VKPEGWLLVAAAGGLAGLAAALAARRLSEDAAAPPLWCVAAFEAGLAVWAAAVAGPSDSAVSILLATALLALALVDVAVLRLPDVVTLPLALAGIGLAVLRGRDVLDHVAGAVAGYAALAALAAGFRAVRGKDGLGLGDAKLLAAAGGWLGWRALPMTVLLACVVAFAWAAVRALRHGRPAFDRPLPFGAPLALGFWLIWLYGTP